MALEFEKESLKMALQNIKDRKLRSILTTLGIVIGISAVISLISVGQGTTQFITGQLSGLGANKLLIGAEQRGSFTGPPSSPQQLKSKDLDQIRAVRGVELATPLLVKTLPVEFRGETAVISLFGIESASASKVFIDIQGFDLAEGRFPNTGEKNFILLGPITAQKIFSKEIVLGNKLTIEGQDFKVIGIFKETGQQSNDQGAVIDIDTLRQITNSSDQTSFMLAKVSNIDNIDQIAQNIQSILDKNHGEKTFGVTTTQQLIESISSVFTALSVILAGIAGIALIVAGIGIANTMFISVVERTRIIGIMKAIGATRGNVYEIFLMEAAWIGLIGGAIGDAIGIVLSQIVGIAAKNFGLGLQTAVTPDLLIFGIGFSVIIAVIFGFLPARRASKLKPIEALRYE